MDAQALAERLPDILRHFPEISLVYLFGSRVESQPGPLSDYDLGVLVDHPAQDRSIQARFAHELAKLLQTDRIDVVLLNRAPVELAYHVIAQGKALYARDVATRVEYEAQVLGRYGDYLPILRAQRSQILQGDDYASRVQRYREALRRTERTLSQIAAAAEQDAR